MMGRRIAVVGPPHSGKTVFLHALDRELRALGQSLLVVRACPDGEGMYSQEADLDLVRRLRVKGRFSDAFVRWAAFGIEAAGRHLPLVLADMSGVFDDYQIPILAACNSYVVLSSSEEDGRLWQRRCTEAGLEPIAVLESRLGGVDEVFDTGSPLRGRVVGLERGRPADSPTIRALARRLKTPPCPEPPTPDRYRLPPQTDIDPADLPYILDLLPRGLPRLVLAGHSPIWLYCAAAERLAPTAVSFVNPRIEEEVALVRSRIGQVAGPIQFTVVTRERFTLVSFEIPGKILDHRDLPLITAPSVLPDRGLVISGPGPAWLYGSLVWGYRDQVRWIATYDLRLKGGVTVRRAGPPDPEIGEVVPVQM